MAEAKNGSPRQNRRNYNYFKPGRQSNSDIFQKCRNDDRLKFEMYWDEAAVTAGLNSGQLLLVSASLHIRLHVFSLEFHIQF